MNTKKNLLLLFFGIIISLVIFYVGIIAEQHNFSKRLAYRIRGPLPKEPFVIPPAHRGKLAIFVLAGQSNMEGDGSLEEYPIVNTRNRVFLFDHTYQWKVGKEPVRGNKVGPSIAFAKALIDADTSLTVGIINCARGGTNIGQWQRHFEDDSLYATMIKLSRSASFQGEIKGLLFFQGENDAEGDSYDHPSEWAKYFSLFVSDVRKDLNNPTLPIVFAQIGYVEGNFLWNQIKTQQASVSLPNVKMIKTDDLPYQAKNIHYTTPAYLEIGKRFAEKYTEIVNANSVSKK